MKLANAVKQAYERAWSMINTFTIQIDLSTNMSNVVGRFTEDINLNIISFNTPDYTNDPIASFVANKWLIYNGRNQLFRFSITFRDQDQMLLYRVFCKIYNYTGQNYFDDSAMTITITKDADWFQESDKKFMILEGVLIEGISNVSFNNTTENQIAEFTVNFRCSTAII